MKRLILLLCILFVCHNLLAIVKLPSIFSDNMVLQRNAPVKVWGSAGAREKILVHFNKQIKQTIADSEGNWKLLLNKELAGGSYVLKVKGENNIVEYKNILVGDVWLCSGQSNMEWQLINTLNGDAAVRNSDNDFIRRLKVPHDISTIPSENIKPTSWQLCNATNAGDFTAAGYFFAKKLQQELNVPIGIINSSWGGTMIETWVSKKALIYPLANFSIRGVIWYQGESNADRAAQYVTSFPMLIKNWRSSFKQPLLPLYFVQLTSFNANNKNSTGGSKGQSYEKRN